ncbi:hypothetical protein BKA67DRAFT_663085 [Truncatella angustata]|uniref:Uncharacterized protein n=1 Tax=Truncatella angustata TaxID=152316 RepID=A0A9P8U9U4_9PEZI|nr:uncharacterized protein BKA67DRAFT_663085 [Truncatella angustata]KAH6646684.1 hypothetical protein BKA67DRAFT_663085 [Truncatella angustata]KAH8204220.1 hypothetical protein TruAng_001640 [Truncatella angustata]
MAPVSWWLKVALGLLMVVSIIELGFVTATVGWLHSTASKGFRFRSNTSTYQLAGIPSAFLVDQGHTSNGAAGTAFVLIGLGGIVALWIRSRIDYHSSNPARFIYYLWLALNVPALLLTAGALGYVFYVTNARRGQTIDVALAAKLDGSPYTLGSWTPQNWFAAVLQLDLVGGRDDISSHLQIMTGWQYNLIPFLVVQLVETVLAFMDFVRWRNSGGKNESWVIHNNDTA